MTKYTFVPNYIVPVVFL